MTELAALNIRITGDSKDLSAAVSTAQGDLNKLATASQATSKNMKVLQAGSVSTGTGMASMSQKLRGASQQLSQVGQQTMATGDFVQALAIQLPDLGLAFGAAGAAAGLLAGIALPMLVSAFGGASEKAAALAAATTGLTDATEAFRITAASIMLGVDEAEVLNAEELNRLMGERIALIDEMAAARGRALIPLQLELSSIDAQISAQQEILNSYRTQRDEANQLVKTQKASKDAMAAIAAMAPKSGWLAGAISDASLLAGELWGAAEAAAAAVNARDMLGQMAIEFSPGGQAMKAYGSRGQNAAQIALAARNAPKDSGVGAGSSGGAASNAIQSELAAMQESLMTQEQLQMESYARQQEMLDQALSQRLISQEEYQNLMQQAQQTHDFAMTQSVNQGVSDTLNALGSLFKGSKKISAAIAVANSWLAFTEVLKDPSFVGRPWARVAAAGQALAAGLNAVRSIKSASPGGGGGGGGSSAQSGGGQQSASPLQVNLNTYGFGDFMKTGDLRGLLTQLNKVAGDTGYTILVPA